MSKTPEQLAKAAAYQRAWKEKNPERAKQLQRESYRRSVASGANARNNSEVRRFQKHGTTKADFEALIESQGASCALCLEPGTWQTLVVDHDHSCCPGQFSCGKCIRGGLCQRCNVALGYVEGIPELLSRVAVYTSTTVTY